MNSNLKRVIGYLIYVVVLGLVVILAETLNHYFQDVFRTTFRAPYLWLFISQIVFPILVGLWLALPHFIRTYRQEGSWTTDWIMLLAVGLPAFLITAAPIVFFTLAYFLQLEMSVPRLIYLLSFNSALPKVFALLFGFVLLNSMGKQKQDGDAVDVNNAA